MRNLWRRLLIKLGLRKPRVYHGARAEVSIIGSDGKRKVIGIFKDITYDVTYDIAPTYILGRPAVSPPENTHERTTT